MVVDIRSFFFVSVGKCDDDIYVSLNIQQYKMNVMR